MRFRIGDYVRITSDYPVDRTLQGQRGDIVCSPEEEHNDRYIVKLDGEITHNPSLEDNLVEVSVNWLEFATRMKPRP